MKYLKKNKILHNIYLNNKLLNSIFVFVLVFVPYISTYSQEYHFNSITVNDGLTQHDVSCIIQDSFGFIWIGTYDGLNRYDGSNILNFLHITDNVESLSSNRILCLFEDSKKRIWIGTDGHGLNYYSLISEKFVRVQTPQGFNLIHGITENSKGEIFIATSKGVLKIIEDNNIVSTDILQLPLTGLSINSIKTNTENTIYFATNNGIWFLKDGTCKQIKNTENQYCSNIIIVKDGNLWGSRNGNLILIEPKNDSYEIKEIKAFPKAYIRGLAESKDGTIWIGTMNKGLFGINPSNYSIIQEIKSTPLDERGLLSNSILCLFCDPTNTLWVGNRQGLCFTNLSNKNFKSISFNEIQNMPHKPHIRTLFADNEFLYYGIQSVGCFRYSIKNKTTKKINTEDDIEPLSMKKINEKLYIGTSKGIYVQRGSNLDFTYDPLITEHDPGTFFAVTSFCEDVNGNIYFGTTNGLIVRKGNTTDWIHYSHPQTGFLRGNRIFSLLYDTEENCVWVGTISSGLYKLNLTADGIFLSLEAYEQSMQKNYKIVNNTIWCFYKGNDGTLWAGTDAGILKKPKNSNAFTQIKTEGIVDKKIMGVIEDKSGSLWLSNSQGLIRFEPALNKVHRYTYKDGLQSSTFTEAIGKNEHGTLFFGSIDGINYFDPLDIKDNPFQSPISISDFKVHNISISPGKTYFGSEVLKKSINLTQELTLNYKQNNFMFEFTGTNYANTEGNQFRYKLEGYNSDWIYTAGDHRFASYSNLEHGTYTFKIEAVNRGEIWSDSSKEILIIILPPPWLSTWAYLFYFIIISGLILSFIFFLNNRQKLKYQINLEHVKNKKDNEINELKLMFFTDIAHEFKTPLSLIIGPLNELTQNKLMPENRDFCLKIVSRNTKRMMFLVNQLLDFRKLNAKKNILKISESDLSEFIQNTTKAFKWQAKNEAINFNVIIPDSHYCFFDRDIIEKVVYNLLSNAFKYTPGNGVVEIKVKPVWKKNKHIANIYIRDSGKGIPNEQKDKIFERYFHGSDRSSSGIGLHLSYELIKAHKGEIIVADSIYGGTEFIVAIPVSKNMYEDFEFFKDEIQNEIPDDILTEIDIQKKDVSEERERILIVEDDHDLRSYLMSILRSNYTVFQARNGIEGTRIATDNLPDIIISDVMMPEMDGIEMCKNLKNNKETSHIPILMLTAKTAQEHQFIGLEAGAWDYITKPFDTRALLKKINNIVESRNRFREAMLGQKINMEIKKHYTPFDQKLISKATKIVEENISNDNFSIEDLAGTIGLSRMQLHRKLKTIVGCSAIEFVNKIKIQYASKMFDSGCDRINEAMDAIGINSYSHFNKLFTKINGKSASEYIANSNRNKKID